MRADINRVKLRLANAGVNLDKFDWKIIAPFWNPTGFDFTCGASRSLQQIADNSTRFAFDTVDLPGGGIDPWLAGGLIAAGYSELDKADHVHLDFAVNDPGRCRVCIASGSTKLKGDVLR